jgi:hypothetical protein
MSPFGLRRERIRRLGAVGWKLLDRDEAVFYKLNVQVITIEHGDTQERLRFGGSNLYEALFLAPKNHSIIEVEDVQSAVTYYGLRSATPSQIEGLDDRRR